MKNLNLIEPSIWAILIMFIVIILMIVVFFIISEQVWQVYLGLFLAFPIVILTFRVLPYIYSKNITCVSVIETKQISSLPNQIMTTDSYIFIVDTKELKTEKTKDTIYKKDSNLNPYIVVTKSTYKAPYKWYINKSSTETKNQTIYILKEVHY